MKCAVVHRRLLSCERPDDPPEDVRAHLAYCSECREWHEDLVLFEQHVAQIPVPRSKAKAALVEQFLKQPPVTPPETIPSMAFPTWPKALAGLAATLLLKLED